MPANGRGGSLKAGFTESATENVPPGAIRVRVKRCGKSAPRSRQREWQGKPHAEQDQIGEEERPAPLLLPGRLLSSRRESAGLEEWLPPAATRVQKPAYRPASPAILTVLSLLQAR